MVIVVCGGGYNVVGIVLCDGGVVIDFLVMWVVLLDLVIGWVWVQGGVMFVDLDYVMVLFVWVVFVGIVIIIGVGGLMLGGGVGWMI